MNKTKKLIKRSSWTLVILVIGMNAVALFHSYKFTHFSAPVCKKTGSAQQLSLSQKINALIFGVNNPRPQNTAVPSAEYQTIKLKSNKEIECWMIGTEKPKGTVVLFHGFGGEKSSLLDKAEIFRQLGYNTMLVDFMGAGGSEGNQTTLGYFEAEQVKACFEYLQATGEEHIYLFGTSMGAVSVMKSVCDNGIQPQGIILECPFGAMYETVCARFKVMKVPPFPMAALLVFWGGIQNGFWAFDHKPTKYAEKIGCPTLLLYGAEDVNVSRLEIDTIFNNLKGTKKLKIYPNAGHENYLIKYKEEWATDVRIFLKQGCGNSKTNNQLIE